ncbi:hypothetical protein CISG_03606 [Coccidioides immitis RMSCC 3703]|uniref:Uncharacterized protein n=1 Tax=Coccidioides immitis RMSCC 3703 TaxID=454286 RepID=A0A0J8QLZ3_COCIT|nr:hypothetical protein CISG_03606 [Coccidioides immitis RMSCC 3703]
MVKVRLLRCFPALVTERWNDILPPRLKVLQRDGNKKSPESLIRIRKELLSLDRRLASSSDIAIGVELSLAASYRAFWPQSQHGVFLARERNNKHRSVPYCATTIVRTQSFVVEQRSTQDLQVVANVDNARAVAHTVGCVKNVVIAFRVV